MAVEELRRLIFSGQLEAGSYYLESALADRLGISRTPVREACLQLAAQGLLEIRPRKGVMISTVSIKDMTEIYEVLTELECLAARQLAERGLSADELSELAQAIDAMEAAIAAGERATWSEQDEVFHSALVRLTGNAHMREIVANFNDRVRWVRNLTLELRPMPTKSNEDHRALCQAIMDGNAVEAERIHRSHRDYASILLIDLLSTSGFSEE